MTLSFEGKSLYAEGEVSRIKDDPVMSRFTLSVDEGDGYGMYEIVNALNHEVEEGSIVRVYGIGSGEKNNLGFPQLLVTVIEKVSDAPEAYTDGIYLVNEEIKPGLYKVKLDGSSGYIARLKDTDMELDSILANENFDGPGYIQIKKNDIAIQISDVKIWKVDKDKLPKAQESEVTEGIHLVGIDIDPGTYKVVPDGDNGYVARLESVDMEMDSIIANENYEGQGYITIKKSDYAVKVSGATLKKK